MSRAFAKEDDGREEPEERPLPSGPNYVTPSGLEELRAKVLSLEKSHGARPKDEQKDLRYFRARLAAAILIDNAKNPPRDIRFGARVRAREDSGRELSLRIVGQDEADPARGLISWDSSLALALNGRTPGERVFWNDGEAERALTVLSLSY